jgi:hypothetical protein
MSTRVANFSSSSIHKLMSMNKSKDGFGAPGLTYIKEKKMEQRLGRSLQNEIDGKEVWWGKLNESRVFGLLPLDYTFEAVTRYSHPTVSNWTGMPDTNRPNVVGDIKCPFSLKSYCTAVDSFGDIEAFKKAKPDWYYQLVSNSILCDKPRAEIIVYVPYKSELDEIRDYCAMFDGNQNKVARFGFADDDDLPYLIEGGHYKNIEIFEFEVPESDKEFLTDRVKQAVELLNQ